MTRAYPSAACYRCFTGTVAPHSAD